MISNLTVRSALILILGSLSTLHAGPKESDDLYFVTIPQSQIIQPKKNHIGTVIFLHGMNYENEPGIGELILRVEKFQDDIPHLKVIFPRAPQAPYTPHRGEPRYIWYDEELITPYRKERTSTFEKAYRDLKKLIQNELDNGLTMEQIIIGGFGQGGTIAMHIAYRFLQNITGVFAIGSYIHDDSVLYKDLNSNHYPRLPTLLIMQGTNDDKTLCLWGESAYSNLRDLEVKGEIIIYKEAEHEVTNEMLNDLWEWTVRLIPNAYGSEKKNKSITS